VTVEDLTPDNEYERLKASQEQSDRLMNLMR